MKIDSRFRQVGRKWENAIEEGLKDAAEVGARTSARVASARTRTGAMSNIQTLPLRHSRRGPSTAFASPVFYWRFHEKGTSRGIKPLRFMAKGRTAARKLMVARIAQHMQKVR